MGGGHDEREQTLNQLLVEMDGFNANEGIIVMSATNRVDILDPAILRPGRFDLKVMVGGPDVKGREEILSVHAKGKPLGDDVDLKEIARTTSGFTGADLENLLNEQEPGSTKAEEPHDKLSRERIEDAIIKMIIENQDDNKVTGLGEVGSRLVSLYPDFDVRSYGYNMLSKFLEEFSRIQLIKQGNLFSVALKEDWGMKEDIDRYVIYLVKKAGKHGIELSTLGNKVYEKYGEFKISDYGYSQFNQYVKSIDKIEVEQEGTILKAKYQKLF